MEIRYKFLDKHNLLIQKYIGEVSLTAYENYLNTITKEKFFSNLKHVITDLTSLNITNVKRTAEKVSSSRNSKVSKQFVEVLVVNSPKTTAFATLFKEVEKGSAKFLFCSTFEKAIELVSVDITIDELTSVLENLEESIS